MDVNNELKRLNNLYSSGSLGKGEFEALNRQVLEEQDSGRT